MLLWPGRRIQGLTEERSEDRNEANDGRHKKYGYKAQQIGNVEKEVSQVLSESSGEAIEGRQECEVFGATYGDSAQEGDDRRPQHREYDDLRYSSRLVGQVAPFE